MKRARPAAPSSSSRTSGARCTRATCSSTRSACCWRARSCASWRATTRCSSSCCRLHDQALAALRAAVVRHGLQGLQIYPPTDLAAASVRIRSRSLMGVPLQEAALDAGPAQAEQAVNRSPEGEACRRAFAAMLGRRDDFAAVAATWNACRSIPAIGAPRPCAAGRDAARAGPHDLRDRQPPRGARAAKTRSGCGRERRASAPTGLQARCLACPRCRASHSGVRQCGTLQTKCWRATLG